MKEEEKRQALQHPSIFLTDCNTTIRNIMFFDTWKQTFQ